MAFEGDVRTGSAKRSQNAAQILGYDPQEYLGDVKLRSFATYCSRIHPDDRTRFEACVYGVRPDNPSYSIAYRFFRFDDGREVWLESTSRTEFDADGRRRRVRGLIRDITERKRAEAALRDREDRMRAIVNTVVDGIITIDVKGRVETLNPAAARMFGYSPEEVIGQNVNMLMPEPYCREHDRLPGQLPNHR
jgi:two-component system sensor kinase FixL